MLIISIDKMELCCFETLSMRLNSERCALCTVCIRNLVISGLHQILHTMPPLTQKRDHVCDKSSPSNYQHH